MKNIWSSSLHCGSYAPKTQMLLFKEKKKKTQYSTYKLHKLAIVFYSGI